MLLLLASTNAFAASTFVNSLKKSTALVNQKVTIAAVANTKISKIKVANSKIGKATLKKTGSKSYVLYFKGKKKGTTKVTYKIGKKKYTTRVYVCKISNIISSIKIGDKTIPLSNLSKNSWLQLKASSYSGEQQIVVTPKGSWKVALDYTQSTIKDEEVVVTVPQTSISNGQSVSILENHSTFIGLTFTNTKTKYQYFVALSFE